MSSPQQVAPVILLPQSLMTLRVLYDALPVPLAPSWTVQYSDQSKRLQLCRLSFFPSMSHQKLVITCEICVQDDLTWSISIHGKQLHQIPNMPLSDDPSILSPSLHKLITMLDEASVCPGTPDDQYVPMITAHKGVFTSVNGEERAHLEKDFPVTLNGAVYYQTIRTTQCSLLL